MIVNGSVTNDDLAGSIANSKLANDSVSYGGVSVDLGASDATPAFNLSDATGYPTGVIATSIANTGATNAAAAATNAGNISTNTSNIASTGATNAAAAATNAGNISTNTSNIASTGATNASAAATNASNISTNTSNIASTGATNASAASTNAGNITTNLGSINAIKASGLYIPTAGTGLQLVGNAINVSGIDSTMIVNGSVTNDDLAGSIANNKLANDSVSYGGISLDLGQTDATPAFNLSDATGYPTGVIATSIAATGATNAASAATNAGNITTNLGSINTIKASGLYIPTAGTGLQLVGNAINVSGIDSTMIVNGSVSNDDLAGSIANAKLANSSVTVTAGDALTGGGSVALGGSVSLAVGVDGSSIEINSDAVRVKAGGVTAAMLNTDVTLDEITDHGATTTNNITVGTTTTSGVLTPLVSGSGAASVTFDLSTASTFTYTIDETTTLALSNVTAGQKFMIRLKQDQTGSRGVNWFSTTYWAEGGTAPTLTTTAYHSDVFGFLCTTSGYYEGFVIGQNISGA